MGFAAKWLVTEMEAMDAIRGRDFCPVSCRAWPRKSVTAFEPTFSARADKMRSFFISGRQNRLAFLLSNAYPARRQCGEHQ